MKQIIQKIESRFEQMGRWIHVHPKRVIIVMLLFFAILASNIPSIQVDTSTEAFFSENDQTRIAYDKFHEQFGRDEIVRALIHPKKVFDIEFLKKLKAFHEDLEAEVPHLDEVQSLINVTAMRGEGGELIIEELMADWPEDDAGVKDLKERVLGNKFYRNFLVSEDGQYKTVVVRSNAFSDVDKDMNQEEILEEGFSDEEDSSLSDNDNPQLLTEEQNSEFVEAIQALAERHRNSEFPIDLGGSPVMVHDLKKAMFSDMPVFVLASLGVIAPLHAQLPSESPHSSRCKGGCGKNTNFNWSGHASYHYRSFRRFFHLHYFVYEQPYIFWSDYRFDHYHRVVWRYLACPSNDGFDLQKTAF